MTRETHQPDTAIVLTGTFAPEDEHTFHHVPFELPANIDQIHLTLDYNDRIGSSPYVKGGNTLDIGLFDPRGTESGSPGFRGWSGSARQEFTVGSAWTTPPYRPGTLQVGMWHVILGVYKVGTPPLEYRIQIDLDPGRPDPGQPDTPQLETLTRASLTPAAEPGWYRGDLHLHTVFSDGDAWPSALAAKAYERGIDFIGITDHNRAQSPVGRVPVGDGWPVLVPGVEITTYTGHVNVWGTDTWYDFRDPTSAGMQAAVDQAVADGGFVSLNHPRPFGPPWEHEDVTGFHAIEAWNGDWARLNTVSTEYWQAQLVAGYRLWALGGSDMHELGAEEQVGNPFAASSLGHPTLWVQTDEVLSANAILDALRAGRSFLSETPDGPQLFLSRDGVTGDVRTRILDAEGNTVLLIGANGVLGQHAIDATDTTVVWARGVVDFAAAGAFVRAEVQREDGTVRALSNPLWLE